MQFNYEMPIAQLGQIANCDPEGICSLTAPFLAQISTVTIVDNDAGAYSVTIVGPEGTNVIPLTVVAQTIAQIADQLAAAGSTLEGLLNVSAVTSDGVSAVTLAFTHVNTDYEVTLTSPSADMTVALTQASGGVSFPLGIGVVDSGSETARKPQSGDLAGDIVGVTVRSPYNLLPFGFSMDQIAASVGPGCKLSAMRQGSCWVRPETSVASGDPLFCRVVAAGAEVFGALRNDADGGDAVALRGRFRSAASAGGLARIEINQP